MQRRRNRSAELRPPCVRAGRLARGLVAAGLLLALDAAADEQAAEESPDADPATGAGPGAGKDRFTARVTAGRPRTELPEERSLTTVTREDLDRRQVRSSPDALRYEAGVFVQQTAHGQGSAFIRGLTGQQTLLLFDGIRLNNSTYRQGPNQYFFTLDSQTIQSIQVLRGGGSTRGGSDALGGVVSFVTKDPHDYVGKDGGQFASAKLLYGSADRGSTESATWAGANARDGFVLVATHRDFSELNNRGDVVPRHRC